MDKALLKLFPVWLISLLVTVKVQAQSQSTSWLPLGPDDNNSQLTSGAVTYTSTTTDANDLPYIAFADAANGGKVTVKKFDGNSWSTVGLASLSAGPASYLSLKINNTTPYIAYADGSNSGKATVKMFDGTNWVTVGTEGFSNGQVTNTSLAFNGDTPYISYTDATDGNKATVKRFDGTTWVTVGVPAFSTGTATYLTLAFNGTTPYVAYIDYAYNGGYVTVKMLNGNAWATVGTEGFSTGRANSLGFGFNDNIPYVAYSDVSNSGKAKVMRFNRTSNNWVLVGTPGFAPYLNGGTYTNVVFSFNSGIFYAAYTDPSTYPASYATKLTVSKFDGNTWALVGTAGFSSGRADYPSVAFNGKTPYVAYSDASNNGMASVKKFDGSNWTTVLGTGITDNPAGAVSLAFNGSTPYVAYSDSNNGLKVSVKKFDGNNWINVGTKNFATPFLNYFSLDIGSDGTPYIVYTDQDNRGKATVKKFDGSDWVIVGTAGFTQNDVRYPSIKINHGVPYIVYQGGAYNNGGAGFVMSFNGTSWENVGSSFSGYINYPALAFNGNTPYVVYSDGLLSATYLSEAGATVKKFVGGSWVPVGSAKFSSTPITNPSIAFDGNTPYVAYTNVIGGNEIIKKFNGTGWETTGTASFLSNSSGTTAFSTAFIGSIPYIAYKDGSNGGKTTVSKYDGNNWIKVGNTSVSSNVAGSGTLIFNNNKLYLAYAINGAFVKYFDVPVPKASQTITFATIPAKILGDADFTLNATSSSGLPVTFTNSNPTVATVSADGSVHLLAAGTTNITASQVGDAYNLAAENVLLSLTVNPSLQPPVQVQSWLPVGPDDNNQPSTNLMNNLHIVTDANGTPYVAYADYGHQNSKITVKKFDGNSWVLVGKPGFSAGVANSISLAFNGTNPYVAYYDSGNGNKPTVMKFNGSNWESVGPIGFSGNLSAGTGGSISLAFYNGLPYVAFADYNYGYNGGKATLMKFDGTSWVTIGAPGFTSGGSYSISLAFNAEGIPYISYYDVDNSNKATVMRFDGSNWVLVGAPGFSAGATYFTSFVINGNTPYVAYADGSNGNKATVMKFDGTDWASVGNADFSKGAVGNISLTFKDNTPFVAYNDAANGAKITFMIFNGVNWQQVGEDSSAEQINFTSIAFSLGTPYIAYDDSDNAGKVTVKKYNGSNWQTVGTPSFVHGYTLSTSLAFNGSTPYVAYEDSRNNFKTSVAEFTEGKWTSVGILGFTAGETYYTSLAFDNATPYVAFRDIANSNKVTVMRFDGNGWVTVGSPGFSVGAADYVSLVIKGGVPYVAYRDEVFGKKVTVMKFVNSRWETIGWPGFSGSSSTVEADYISFAFNGDVPYVAYMDYASGWTGGMATVMKFESNNWVTVGPASFTNGAATYTSLAFNKDIPYLAYADGNNGGKATVKKFEGGSWVSVGRGFSVGSTAYTSLTFNGDEPYVSYQDNANDDKATVMKFNGSNWMAVGGSAGFSADEANYPSIAINDNKVYVAYDSRGVFVKYFGSTPPPASSNTLLSNLTLNTGTLTPVFSSDSVSYTASIPNATTSITLTPTLAHANAIVKVNDVAVASGAASAAIPLAIGFNTIKTVVTAQDGTTEKTYTLTVNRAKASQTITFATLSAKTYGDTDFKLNATSDNGTLPITYSSSNPAIATIVDGKIHLVSAGTTNITASQVGDNSFLAATDVVQKLTVNKASLTITADNQTKTYGAANPALTVSYSGFVNGDNKDSLTTKPAVSTTATAASAPGTYAITVAGAASVNYTITYVNGTLSIGQTGQTITFAALPAKTYGDADFTLNAGTSSRLVVTYSSTNPSVATVNAVGAVHILSAGVTDITASQTGNENYNSAASVTQKLTVNKASLTVTANNQTKTYGSANPDLTISYSGFVSGDTPSVITAQAAVSTTATTTSDAGTYPVTATGAAAANYSFTYVPGTLTVTQVTQTITFATVPAKAYGDADFNPGATSSSGLPINYSSSNPAILSVVNGKLHIVGAGTATITANQAGNVNYLTAASVSQDIAVIFTLPSNNFTISATGESCKNSSNGEINISAASNLNYTATIISGGISTPYPFNNKLSIKNLAAGTYPVCITLTAYPAFKQCFDVTVTAPKDLSVYSVVNPASGTVNLNLAGSSSYNISLNSTSYTTSKSTISLPLEAGKNTLMVSTSSPCQGVYEKTLELPASITAYPNPFESRLSVSLANDRSQSATGEVYNMQGKMVYSGKTSVSQGTCSFDLSTLSPGNYVLRLVLEHSETNIKIIKK